MPTAVAPRLPSLPSIVRRRRLRNCTTPCASSSHPLALSLEQGVAAHAAGIPFIDVRTQREFRSDSIATSRCAPLWLVPATVPLGAVDLVLRRLSDGPESERPAFSPSFETDFKAALRDGEEAVIVCSDGLRSQVRLGLAEVEEFACPAVHRGRPCAGPWRTPPFSASRAITWSLGG